LSLQATNALCGRNDGLVQSFTGGGTAPYQYQWSNGSSTSFIYNLTPGTYALNLKDANNCTASASAVVKDSFNVLNLFLGNDTSFCPGNTLTLKAGIFDTYRWQDNSANPSFTVTKTGKYYVSVTDDDGCKASDTIQVVVDCSDVYFPTGFTPNNDNRNDRFGAVGNLAALKNYRFEVYNRWGQLVFATTNPYQKWDGTINGKPADSGTYVWFAFYNLNSNPQRSQKGTVTMLR
jgi:gliding motility-associated-like protein